MRRRTSLVTAALTALLAAGCGITDEGARPGVAVEVDGQTLPLSQVDQAVEDYCTLLATHEDEQPVPTSAVRAGVARDWARAVAVDEIAPEYDVDVPSAEIERSFVERSWSMLGEITDDNYETFEWITWIQLRLSDPLLAIGQKAILKETGQPAASLDDAQVRGYDIVHEWLDEHDWVVNPALGELDEETGAITGDVLSVPVSGEARGRDDVRDVTPEQLADLPAGQRCGPAVQTQPGA